MKNHLNVICESRLTQMMVDKIVYCTLCEQGRGMAQVHWPSNLQGALEESGVPLEAHFPGPQTLRTHETLSSLEWPEALCSVSPFLMSQCIRSVRHHDSAEFTAI